MKTYQKLPIPNESAWDKKSYDPIKWLYNLKEEQPEWLDNYFFDPYFNCKSWVIGLFNFIIKLFKWIPILWKDRDWDDYFIFEILKQKIIQQRDYLVSHNRHTNIGYDNYWMTVCLNLIERIQESYYELEYSDYKDVNISFVPTDSVSEYNGQELFEMKSECTRDNTLEYINKYPLDKNITLKTELGKGRDLYDYLTNQESRFTLCLLMSSYRQQKAIDLLFKILSKKITHWWD